MWMRIGQRVERAFERRANKQRLAEKAEAERERQKQKALRHDMKLLFDVRGENYGDGSN
jgi:hypothetical protein